MTYDYYEFGEEGGSLMRRAEDGVTLSRLDKATGEWVEDNYLFTYLYRGDSEEISEDEAKALAAKLCPGQELPFD
ncbi:hypothetical protein [Cupriavidus sp. IK-TO18]|uniref:hypothetical protein n=1 Tax=Cupriavidus sp. IK-TO18 TaxID=2782182 RepID=UPI0018978D5D|nr:hypothetical protein [Cupriavidus sp. IK-TO18]MBF6986747.1 hypothetical protein [Cupriavidus sp. IK-TO18]